MKHCTFKWVDFFNIKEIQTDLFKLCILIQEPILLLLIVQTVFNIKTVIRRKKSMCKYYLDRG